jgi:hypothetical protein
MRKSGREKHEFRRLVARVAGAVAEVHARSPQRARAACRWPRRRSLRRYGIMGAWQTFQPDVLGAGRRAGGFYPDRPSGSDICARVSAGRFMNVWLQRLLPQHALSRLVLIATRIRTPWFRNALIRAFLRFYPVDLARPSTTTRKATAASTSSSPARCAPAQGPSPRARPILRAPSMVRSASADASTGTGFCRPRDAAMAWRTCWPARTGPARFAGGQFATDLPCAVQLSPDPHAAQRPAAGLRLRARMPVQRQRGDRAALPRLFARNERVLTRFESPRAPSRWCWSER